MSKEITTKPGAPATGMRLRMKLLAARRKFREEQTSFSKFFDLHRGFEAFSVHILAGNIEPVLNEMGVMTECHVIKWSKQGNVTVVECRLDFVDAETEEVFSVLTVGEGVDGSDKGIGKAISNARKQGHIQAFNLAIGVDVEDDDQRASGLGSLGGQMNYAGPASAFPASASKPYEIETMDGEIIEVVEADLIARFIGCVNELNSPDAVDAFASRNGNLANRLIHEQQAGILGTLENALSVRKAKFEAADAAAA